MTTQVQFKRFFSVDSHKAIKAQSYGWLNGINYMAPHKAGGKFNLCSHASAGCIALCLGLWSGQAAMISADTGTNSVRDSRVRKAQYFMTQRNAYMIEMLRHIAKLYRYAKRNKFKLAIRPNGSTDIAYEGIRVMVTFDLARELTAITGREILVGAHTIFSCFPWIQFVDYTKNPKRFDRALPANYSLTFSRSETNDSDSIALLNRGINVAVVFAKALPKHWNGFQVINGDKHDLRHLDPQGGKVVGLLPKGSKAKRDSSGFVVRLAA
jgi:hypothetical protein